MNRHELPVRTRLRALALSVCFAMAAAPALAADAVAPPAAKPPAKAAAKPPARTDVKAGESASGKAVASDPLLTRDELRQCVTEQERMKRETTDIVQAQAALAKDRAELERVSAAIDADRAGVDRTDQAAVDAFNERAKARARQVESYQAAALRFNQRVDKLEADEKDYAKACTNRRYDNKDLEAIKAGK